MDEHATADANAGPLTDQRDWVAYYARLADSQWLERQAEQRTLFDEFLCSRAGHIFELGCAASPVLARAAMFGWCAAGIDFSSSGLRYLEAFLRRHGLRVGELIDGDVFSAPVGSLRGTVDLLVSAGFLEHFTNPVAILRKWSGVLKPGGLVISAIPNLLSINAAIFKRYDPQFWQQHCVYAPAQLDEYHRAAGLEPVRPCRYVGKYDIHMLIPWERIAERFRHRQLYRAFKLATYFGVGVPLHALPIQPGPRLSPYVVGVYRRAA